MTTYPTPVKIAAKPLHDALRLQTVLTIETVEAALYQHVYRLWEARGMFGHDHADDLDTAAAIIDDARHAITGPGRRIDKTMQALLTEDALRIVREWEQRKRAAADPTPTSVRVHESNAEFARPMLDALPDAAIDRRTEAGL